MTATGSGSVSPKKRPARECGSAGGEIAGRDAADQRHGPLHGDRGRIAVGGVEDSLAGYGGAGIGGQASDGAGGLNAGQGLNALCQFTEKCHAARSGSIARIEEAEIHRKDAFDTVAAIRAHDVDEAVQQQRGGGEQGGSERHLDGHQRLAEAGGAASAERGAGGLLQGSGRILAPDLEGGQCAAHDAGPQAGGESEAERCKVETGRRQISQFGRTVGNQETG